MEEKKDEILLEIKQNISGRIISVLFNVVGVSVSLLLFFIFKNTIIKACLFIVVFFFVYELINMLIFKKLIFTNKGIKKEYFNLLKYSTSHYFLKYENLCVSFWNRYWLAKIIFWEKNKKWKTKWKYSINLDGVSNKNIETIKQILIDKKIIKGDEYEWYY